MAEKSQIATTIEQSKRLLAAGLDRRSADMMWVVPESNGLWDEDENTPDPPASLKCQNYGRYCDTPAWSLSRLIDLIAETGIPMNYGPMKDSADVLECAVRLLEYELEDASH